MPCYSSAILAERPGRLGDVRGTWDRRRAAAIAIGGVAGAGVRWAVIAGAGVGVGGFPWPVLAVNVAGSVLLGVVLAEESAHRATRLVLHDGVAIGFCGGLTTFSTFAVEIAALVGDGHLITAGVYGLASVLGAVLGVVAGAASLRRVRAAALPLEERP